MAYGLKASSCDPLNDTLVQGLFNGDTILPPPIPGLHSTNLRRYTE